MPFLIMYNIMQVNYTTVKETKCEKKQDRGI